MEQSMELFNFDESFIAEERKPSRSKVVKAITKAAIPGCGPKSKPQRHDDNVGVTR